MSKHNGRRGRPFTSGNPGRPPGSKNKSTMLAAALLEGELQELLRTAIELAKAEDVAILKFLLGRLLPRDRLIALDLPKMRSASDLVNGLQCIFQSVSEGIISPREGADLADLMNSYARAVDLVDLVKRMETLEARISGSE